MAWRPSSSSRTAPPLRSTSRAAAPSESGSAKPIADLQHDGTYGIAIADSYDGHSRLRYLDGSGQPIWDAMLSDLPEVSAGNGAYAWVAGDLRGTGTDDVFLAGFEGGYNTMVSRVISGTDGSTLSSRDDSPLNPDIGFGPWVGNSAVADLDGDGADEVYFQAMDIIYQITGGDLSAPEQIFGHSNPNDPPGISRLYHNPTFIDLTGGGTWSY
ncbi:hypothetical protein [Dactylosporangium sp. CA-233914]|uniref:hypothetical protein n=1 Tax=Dactylosporangium sp. CA-233914 TaxID=3239934 RepID=UPI003D93F804